MKKTYISPLMSEVNVEATNMLAASLVMSDKSVDTATQQLGSERRGEWGNLRNYIRYTTNVVETLSGSFDVRSNSRVQHGQGSCHAGAVDAHRKWGNLWN